MPLQRSASASLVVTALAVAVGASGCASVIALDDLHRSSGSGSSSNGADAGGSAPSASTGASGPGAGSSSGGSAPAATTTGDPSCGAHPGPPMVRVTKDGDSFCVGATQVTGDDYAAFLASHPTPGSLPDGCAPHPDFHPAGLPQAPTAPITGVDWCDATAYCAWAGERLCGRLGGGSLDGSGSDKAEWSAACASGALVAGTGVGDWEDACSGNDGDDTCSVRGAACDAQADRARTDLAAGAGIRCCAP